MKNVKNNSPRQNKQGLSRVPKHDVRDNLDSRVNEEQDFKGSDTTHNHKETKEEKHRH